MKKTVLTVASLIALTLPANISARSTAGLTAYEPYSSTYQRNDTTQTYYYYQPQRATDEKGIYEDILDDWNLEDYQYFLNEYPRSQYAREIRSRVEEMQLWQNARNRDTLEGYQDYIRNSKYGRYNKQAIDAMDRLQAEQTEKDWKNACGINTVAAYQSFISQYPGAPQVAQANARIENLRTQEAWDRIKDSYDTDQLEQFIFDYPNFQDLEYAKSRLHAIKMEDYLDNNDIDMASQEFDYITMPEAVPETATFAYGIVEEYNGFRKLSPRSSETELQNFLTKYPGSKHIADVRNYIALNKANRFTTSSTKEDYENALFYATGNTRTAVQQAIKTNDRNISTEKARGRKMRRDSNGGWMGLTFEYIDLSWNGRTTNGVINYNFGIKFRLGNYGDRVQMSLGAKPGVGIWDFDGIYVADEYGYDKEKSSAFFEMPLEADLKLNLCRAGDSAWFFLEGCYQYNIIRKKEVQRPMGIRAGLGWAGYGWDIFFYYGREMGSIDEEYRFLNGYPNPFMDSKAVNYFGMSISATVKLF